MKKNEQKKLVRDITRKIAAEIIAAIDSGKVPEEWDGHELREMVYDKAAASRAYIFQGRGCIRSRNYRNEVIVRNL